MSNNTSTLVTKLLDEKRFEGLEDGDGEMVVVRGRGDARCVKSRKKAVWSVGNIGRTSRRSI